MTTVQLFNDDTKLAAFRLLFNGVSMSPVKLTVSRLEA